MRGSFMFLLLAGLLMTGCSSAPTKSSAQALPPGVQFAEPEITVNLTQKRQVDGYPDQTEFARLLKEKTVVAFTENGLLATSVAEKVMTVKIEVNYQRRFAGEDTPLPSKSVMAPVIDYTIVIFDQAVEKGRIERKKLTINKGLGSNLASMFTLGLGKEAKDEEQDMQTLANSLAREVKVLRR